MKLEDKLSIQRYENRQRIIEAINTLLSRNSRLNGTTGGKKQALKCLLGISNPDDRNVLESLIQLGECIIENPAKYDTSSWRWYCSGEISFNTIEDCKEIDKDTRIFKKGRDYYESIFKKRIEEGGGCACRPIGSAGKKNKELLAEAVSNNKSIAERCGLIVQNLPTEVSEKIVFDINPVQTPLVTVISENIEKPTNIEDIESSIDFSLVNLKDSREKVLTSICQRRGQKTFRANLLKVYGGRCSITDCNAQEALEAAHIHPYMGEYTNCTNNGLLLRADIHTLFDLYLISIHPDSKKVVVSSKLDNTSPIQG